MEQPPKKPRVPKLVRFVLVNSLTGVLIGWLIAGAFVYFNINGFGAMLIAGALGVVLAILEKQKARWAKFVPSPASIGIAMVIPAFYSLSMFLGSAVALLLTRAVPNWSARFLIVVASGLVAGESLAGVGLAIQETLRFATTR